MPAQDRVGVARRWQRSVRGSRRMRAANTARSAQSSRGFRLVRRSTATSWRSTRSSTSLVEDERLSSRISPSTCRKIRYDNRSDTAAIMPGCLMSSITAGQRPCPTSGTPQALARTADDLAKARYKFSQRGMLVDAGCPERSAAGAGGDLAALEVVEELGPLVVGRDAVFLAGAQGSAAGEECQVGLDGLVGVDGLVSHGDVDVAVPGDDLGDVRRQAGQDGVGDEHPPEVVRGEVQRAAGLWVGQRTVGEGGVEHVADRAGADPAVLGTESALEQPGGGRQDLAHFS